jgi:hypothetical protein
MMAQAIQQRLVNVVKLDYDVRSVCLPTQHGPNIAGATVGPLYIGGTPGTLVLEVAAG